ncbi:hypothetical protein A2U01_0119268, partial [Trifolium medium]|nr:hypothetical protein [Trifolium medium]
SQKEMPQLATAGDILATTLPGNTWRPPRTAPGDI